MATFAFTDIEGSTTRWERERAAMEEALRRHDAILRAEITKHDGRVFKTMGDAFYSVFAQPKDAVAAMLAAQRSLLDEDFSAVDGLRVRAAIHTGSADERDGDYFGSTLNKVSRLLAIGHGSQILLTSEAAALVDGELPAGVSLRELGAYPLKGLKDPQRVYQLDAPGLPSEFLPLRSLGTLSSDLSIADTHEFSAVPSFSGREAELAALHAALERDGAVAVVHGLSGIGKSSVAREYGWSNRGGYSVIWWLNAETEDGIVDGLLRLGAMFEQGLDHLADRRAAAQRVVNSLLGGFDKPVLLVFDNLEDEGLLRRWLPRTGARAVATSHSAAWSAEVATIALDTWPLETAAGYLQRESGRADLSDAGARAIAEALGTLPLALSHAAAALRTMRTVSPRRYLERVNEHLKNAPRGCAYPRSVFATFNTAIAQAEQQAAGAAAVLCFAACFAPDAIPEELFRQRIGEYAEHLRPVIPDAGEPLDLRAAMANEFRLDEALGALDRLSLLAFAQNSRTHSMHRLVQRAAKDLIAATARRWRECAVGVANAVFPEVEFARWPRCERILPHARAALEAFPGDTGPVSAAGLANRCSTYLRGRGEYSAAAALSTRALAVQEKALGPDHPDVANSLYGLALVYWNQGRYAEAEPLYRRTLAIMEQALQTNHPDFARTLNGLALVYWYQGRYAEAEPLYTRALAIWEESLGPDHPHVAHCLNNLAIVYHEQGRYAEEALLHTRALAIREKALGPDHPEVAASLNNVAMVYHDQGRYADAEPLHTRALAIKEKALGPDHPDVAQSLSNLAVTYHGLGRYAEAEPLHTRALAIKEKALGPDHPNVAQSLHDLASVHRGQGRYSEAERFHARALTIRENALGLEHPEVADSLHELASVYGDRGRHQEAEPLLSRALWIREKALGANHPSTISTREALNTLRSNT